jgi:hypothetical protein
MLVDEGAAYKREAMRLFGTAPRSPHPGGRTEYPIPSTTSGAARLVRKNGTGSGKPDLVRTWSARVCEKTVSDGNRREVKSQAS